MYLPSASADGLTGIHDVSAFTIGNTLLETWRGVRVMRSYSSIDKSNFYVFWLHSSPAYTNNILV